ncbi:MAG: PAS domain-containing protein [Rhodothermales bacterium]|nr:PAS domain-containing protein [Rhodothermales bacterium]
MPSTIIAAAGPYLISGILALVLSAAILFRRRTSRTTLFLGLGTLATGMWSMMSGFHLVVDDVAVKIFLVHGKYLFTSATPVLWLLTALAYAGSPLARSRSFTRTLIVYPLITTLLVATNQYHGLMFTSVTPVNTDWYSSIGHTYGPAFWTYAAIGYVMILAGLIVIGRTVISRQGYIRRQSVLMTIAALVPIVFSVWFLSHPDRDTILDYTPVSFLVTNAAFAIAILRYRMLSLMPVARREVIRLMDAPVIVTDIEGYIEGLNPAAERIRARSSGQPVGQPILDYIPELTPVLREAIEEGRSEGEIRIVQASESAWYLARAKSFEAGPGHPPGFVFVLHDVTQMREAREKAEELSRLKSTFLSNMSHEIRTPLTAIIGVSDLLLETESGADEEMIGMIKTSGERLLRMLNSVLSVSSLQSGTMLHRPESVDLTGIVRGVVAEYRQLAEDAMIELEADLPREPVSARIDPLHVGHVLSHLLDNAIRYTPSGSVSVRFEAGPKDVTVTVRDTGSGIPESFLPRVGNPFDQAESGDSRPVDGAGLGLAVVWGLVDVMGGSVSLDSEPGRGSIFRIVLPRWDSEYEDPTPGPMRSDRQPLPSTSTSPNGSPIRSR